MSLVSFNAYKSLSEPSIIYMWIKTKIVEMEMTTHGEYQS